MPREETLLKADEETDHETDADEEDDESDVDPSLVPLPPFPDAG
jgi:hypothetical protein